MSNDRFQPNPYLAYLTNGEPNLDWFWALLVGFPCLWFISGVLILVSSSTMSSTLQIYSLLEATATIGLPLSILAIIILLAHFLLTGTQFVFAETQKEQFTFLRLTNISSEIIFVNLILGLIYRKRRWIIATIGLFPFLLSLMCQWYLTLRINPPGLSWCYLSPLGHTYCYQDGPTFPNFLLEFFGFLSITIAVLGITTCATFCSVVFTMKSKNGLTSNVALLMLVIPLVLVLVLLIAPEGFLWIETIYRLESIARRVFGACAVIAVLPCLAAFGTQYLLRRWVLN